MLYYQETAKEITLISIAPNCTVLAGIAIAQLERMRDFSRKTSDTIGGYDQIGMIGGSFVSSTDDASDDPMPILQATIAGYKREREGFFFSQLLFEERMQTLQINAGITQLEYEQQKREQFYRPVFESRYIDVMYFCQIGAILNKLVLSESCLCKTLSLVRWLDQR